MVIDSLIENIKEKETPIVVGLDPTVLSIPKIIYSSKMYEFGNTKRAVAEAFWEFNKNIIDYTHDLIPAVKLQSACYELYGSYGIDVFERSISYAKKKGLSIIDDSKRNDIGSTASLYARAHLGCSPLFLEKECCEAPSDFLTINPYLGTDGLQPFIDECVKHQKGIFILCKTSNPSSVEFQDLKCGDKKNYELVAERINQLSAQLLGNNKYSSVGAVVGATHPDAAKNIRDLMPRSFFLVPGYGAQGGTAKDLKPFFNEDGLGAIINSSRGIINAWKSKKYTEQIKYHDEKYAEIARLAVLDMKQDLNQIFD